MSVNQSTRFFIALVFLGFAIALLIRAITVDFTQLLLIGILALLGMMVLTIFLDFERINKINAGPVSVDLSQLQKDVNNIQKNVNKNVDNIKNIEGKIDDLGNSINELLISTALDAYEYVTLLKLTDKEVDDNYEFNPKGQDQLERLINRYLIEEKENPNYQSIFQDRTSRNIKLKICFFLTDRGKEYLNILEQTGLNKKLRETVDKLEKNRRY